MISEIPIAKKWYGRKRCETKKEDMPMHLNGEYVIAGVPNAGSSAIFAATAPIASMSDVMTMSAPAAMAARMVSHSIPVSGQPVRRQRSCHPLRDEILRRHFFAQPHAVFR